MARDLFDENEITKPLPLPPPPRRPSAWTRLRFRLWWLSLAVRNWWGRRRERKIIEAARRSDLRITMRVEVLGFDGRDTIPDSDEAVQ